jgi:3-hydroxyisobutyrate dehydrogenase-like beta-hydroxyacid dehydrogenase
MVRNRSVAKRGMLGKAGATVAASPAEVFVRFDVVILMLSDANAASVIRPDGLEALPAQGEHQGELVAVSGFRKVMQPICRH